MDAGLWFREWTSKDGLKLSDMQITRLVALTRQWRNNMTSDTLSVWTSDTSAKFWGFEPSHTESAWIQECLKPDISTFEDGDANADDYEKVPARRRVLLIILYDIIEREILRLRASFQAQSAKFLSTAVKNVVDRAYPSIDNQHLRAKCTILQRAGKKYSLLAKKEWVLAPLQGTSSNFERPKGDKIQTEALVAFGEATYDEKHRNDLHKAFECIMNTCPFKKTGTTNLRLPSHSRRRRLRERAARTKKQHQITSHENQTRIFRNSMHAEHTLDFNSSEPQPGPFIPLEDPSDSAKSSSHIPDSALIVQVSEEVLNPAEAWGAAFVQPEEHLSDIRFNPSVSLENLPTQHVNQLVYGTWSASANPYFNPSASLDSLPGKFQQNNMRDMRLEQTNPSYNPPPRFNPSGYLENLPQIPQNPITFNTEPTAIVVPYSTPSASVEGLPGKFQQNNMRDMRLEKTQPFNSSPLQFNPSNYLENLPPANSIAFDITEPTATELPCLNPSASLESLPFPQDDMRDMRREETQHFNHSLPRSNTSGYLENLPQISQNSIAFNNTEPTALDRPCSNPSGSLESLPSTYWSSIAPLLNNTQPHHPSGTDFNPSGSREAFPSATFGFETTRRDNGFAASHEQPPQQI